MLLLLDGSSTNGLWVKGCNWMEEWEWGGLSGFSPHMDITQMGLSSSSHACNASLLV